MPSTPPLRKSREYSPCEFSVTPWHSSTHPENTHNAPEQHPRHRDTGTGEDAWRLRLRRRGGRNHGPPHQSTWGRMKTRFACGTLTGGTAVKVRDAECAQFMVAKLTNKLVAMLRNNHWIFSRETGWSCPEFCRIPMPADE